MQWGLRGDPYLWNELKESFEDVPVPESVTDFEKILMAAFNTLISDGVAFGSEKRLHIDRYPRKGMSGGFISIEWWQEEGLPLLKNRFQKLINY